VSLLDAYALIALLGDEPAADKVEELLRRGDCSASVVNLAEAIPLLVAVTGYGQPSDLLRAREAGFAQHLVKPVDLDRLRGILAEFFSGAAE